MDTKALKDKILQLAVQGKLVPQDENDEPASILLEQIKKEKEQLINAKIIRKGKLLPDIIESEKLFVLPRGWEWLRVRDIGYNLGQKKPSSKFIYIDVASIDNEKCEITQDIKIIEPEDAPSRARKVVKDGTIIYSTIRPYLMNIAIIDKVFEYPIIASTAFATINCYKGINNKFIYYYFRSNIFKQYVDNHVTGTAYPAINEERFNLGLVPIPPQQEQEKIVSKIESIFKLIDKLDNNKQDLLQDISYSRNKVLQLAIQGKLVSQDENDEPAIFLLEKIKEEKDKLIKTKAIKKEKPLPEISEDEMLFDLPKNWTFIRLGEFIRFIGGNQPPKSTFKYEPEEGYIRLIQIRDYKSDSHITYIPYEKAKRFCSEDDIMIGRYGPPIFQILRGIEGAYNVALMKAEPIAGITKEYLYYLLKDPKLLKGLERLASRTCGQDGIDMDYLKSYVVGLPPIEEQKRIVKKLDMLMNYFDELELKMK